MDIDLSPRKTLVILLFMIGLLLFANLTVLVSRFVFHHGSVYGLVELMDFNGERNLPTLYSSMQLIVVSFLLAIVGSEHRATGETGVPWFVLAVIFFFLAVDETAQIHERLVEPIRTVLEVTGFLYFAWVVPYGIALLVLSIAYSRFLYRLPKETTWRFIAAGVVFVTGAIGFEMIGARHFESYGAENLEYAILYSCEELLEMLGVAYFIYSLLAYVSNKFQFLRITVGQ